MKTQKITAFIGKTGAVASFVAASALTAGFLAPSASAVSLVPDKEGEVNVGLGACLSPSSETGNPCKYLELSPWISDVASLIDDSTGTKSRLFVDKAGTKNTYGAIQFKAFDVGTPVSEFWFRPAAMMADGVTPLLEKGQLEVGTYKFDFAKTISSLTVRWFDTEYKDDTSFVATGIFGDVSGVVPAGPDRNIYEQTFTDVSSITLNLGERGGRFGTGDGVNFQIEKQVPEPGTAAGLGALAFMSTLGLRKRNKKANS
ncbi:MULTISPECIES: LEVG family PEP-CTERM protein [unclassified Coleofasciculus]|uniref:LEVG family PEP-CTERM protein n=1 Tax=unclassified Coleofasciculus TaxID=2692782 RepID=UPI00187FBC21|nr:MULTISPECIES: LEVG family PEP-CTERM protein [unclassified Coleofasciculus]MBE9129977.1 LEVG family PEP-CTERM protein [Coleofasciculus sp. LEGE 07081]MBE9151938.1 LEVG family PEP-CTERM protein [Coleofasciculus sp. LEGE 07092]